MTDRMECLDDNTVLAYAEHLLPEAERLRVEAHLDTCEACLTVACAAAGSNAAVATPGAEPGLPRDPSGIQGTQIGRYALVEMIGRGAMGLVYVAHDPQLDRRVALKVVRSARFVEPELRAQLSREAKAMARVADPHVVTVYDAGELEDGVFIAMELVEGETLAHWLRAETRSWRTIVSMFVAAGRGLAAAHAAGIVHRDFKPENVLVDRRGRAAVTDFGLALAPATPLPDGDALDEVPLTTAHELTRTGVLLGTPRYMSPEQFRREPVDARTDQFSLALALYDALYRTHAFAGTTIGELRAAVLSGTPRARPADTAAAPAIHRVIERALASDRAMRYPAIDEMLDALVAAARPNHMRRRLVGFAAAAAVLSVALVGGFAMTRSEAPVSAPAVADARAAPVAVARLDRDGVRPRVLVERFANHTGDARFDDTVDLVVASTLFRSAVIDPVAGVNLVALASQFEDRPTAVEVLVTKLGAKSAQGNIAVHGAIERAGTGYVLSLEIRSADHAFAATESAATTDDVFAAGTRLAARLLSALGDPLPPGGTEHAISIDALHAYAGAQTQAFAGDLPKAVEGYRRALAADPDFDEARATLGLTLYNLSDRPGAAVELERAFAHGDRMPERQRLSVLGDYYGATGAFADAITAYQQLLARWPGDARTEINITATAIDEGSWPLALDLARRAAKDHANIGVVRGNLVLAELANGRFADASRDGESMLVDIPRPLGFAIAAVAISEVLNGHAADARATYDKLFTLEPELADQGRADLAIYEGRLDDAEAMLHAYADPAIAHGKLEDARNELFTLARVRLQRGDRAGAARFATLARTDGEPRPAYIAASVAAEAGVTKGIADTIRAWGEKPEAEWRVDSKLLAGDLALAQGHATDAVAAYQDANRLGTSWLTRARLGRGYLHAHAWADATRELGWCMDHRGEGAIFITPTLSFVSAVALDLEEARRQAGKPGP